LDFVTKAEAEFHEASIKASHIHWAYATNITDENEKKKTTTIKQVNSSHIWLDTLSCDCTQLDLV